jgi:hypothetical protein
MAVVLGGDNPYEDLFCPIANLEDPVAFGITLTSRN